MPDRSEVPLPEPVEKERFYCNKCGMVGEGHGSMHLRRDGSLCNYMAPTKGPFYTADQLRAHAQQCVAVERERCMLLVYAVDPHLADHEQRDWIWHAIRKGD